MHGKRKKPVYGPGKKEEYDAFGFRNNVVDKFSENQVKDVEKYDPKTGKSKMIYKPAKG